ncbi:cupin domain-containing protein [Caballeronia sp. GAWG1-1]|uniref:(R)-mandelonitrile lyase n=1 Tax=Caballeronia sp. GAWG1-1 TaxID=2921742 RepID=UPI002027C53F|nr:cupin domain-containing protein [Caballeronia sp. GAWG1-1]
MSLFKPILMSVLLCVSVSAHTDSSAPPTIAVIKKDSLTQSDGSASSFSGSVLVTQLFPAKNPSRVSGGLVTFPPGARSAWHTHPLGQTLVITAGTGWVQEWDGKKQEMKAGDIVTIPPGVKHWHGAAATTSVSHIAIQEAVDGNNVQWMEKVTDEQYGN